MSQQPQVGVPVCYRHPGRAANIRCQRCGRPICTDDMIPASVGFQCPVCVADGAKSVRKQRTPYGGAVVANRALVTFGLVAVNVAMWVAILATHGRTSRLIDVLGLRVKGGCQRNDHLYDLGAARCARFGGTLDPGVSGGAYWQLFTSQFVHVEVGHILGNMILLVIVGLSIEPILGRARFLTVYLVSGLAGSVLVYYLTPSYAITYGASGAIFGVLIAALLISIKNKVDLRYIGALVLFNLFFTFNRPGVSWQGHVGGILGGLAITALMIYAPRGPRRSLVQWSGTGGIVALLVLAVVVRSAVLA